MHKYGVVGKLGKFGEAYRTQPFHFHARALLLVSSMAYAVLLYVSPVSSTWRYLLILAHTTRTLKVLLATARGPVEGMVIEASGEDAGDML